jgi:hypothetical protein
MKSFPGNTNIPKSVAYAAEKLSLHFGTFRALSMRYAEIVAKNVVNIHGKNCKIMNFRPSIVPNDIRGRNLRSSSRSSCKAMYFGEDGLHDFSAPNMLIDFGQTLRVV